ncbi:MAG TPA: hypothetical protein VHA78_02960 [Candidatus Peribacteraceae bacterium]|nr:hypothetical protein [Candidatus Peribacteraceae bacterium]
MSNQLSFTRLHPAYDAGNPFPPLLMCGSHCECAGCRAHRFIVALLLILSVIVAFGGVWQTIVMPGTWSLGSAEQSFALLVFVIALMAWFKVAKRLCGCSRKSCCSMCGNCPCTCANGKPANGKMAK